MWPTQIQHCKNKNLDNISGPNGFIPKMQGWFNIQQISIVYHNNGEKGDYHYDLSNWKKKFNKIPLIQGQKFSKQKQKQLGIEKNFLHLMKTSIKNLKLVSMTMVK